MKRREARELAFQLTYEMVMTGEFNPDTRDELFSQSGADADSRGYIVCITDGIASHREELKAKIEKYSKGYDFDRIYRVDLAALYVACYELMFTDTPKAAVCNEAVELVKKYSDVKSHSFVNGILASVIKEIGAEGNG